jgi:GTPase
VGYEERYFVKWKIRFGLTARAVALTIEHMTQTPEAPSHRSGFVALAGRPNVGKSTLLNAILRQPIASVSHLPQTTRKRQLGILTIPEAQILFIDTPGIHKPVHKLGEGMNREARESLRQADLLLVMFDGSSDPHEEDQIVAAAVADFVGSGSQLTLLNKTDLLTDDQLKERIDQYREILPQVEILPTSAKKVEHVSKLLKLLVEKLPEGPQYYPEDQITDLYERDIAADLIRAAAMSELEKEVPHSIAVRIDDYIERDDHGAYIHATLFVERDSQKGIVIGKKGSMLQKIGIRARREIEAMSGRKVFLELRVKVLPGWRNDKNMLKRFGYR